MKDVWGSSLDLAGEKSALRAGKAERGSKQVPMGRDTHSGLGFSYVVTDKSAQNTREGLNQKMSYPWGPLSHGRLRNTLGRALEQLLSKTVGI